MIVNTIEQYNNLINRMNRESHIATPVFRDLYTHSVINPILCVAFTFDNGDFYMVSIRHKDAPRFDVPLSTDFTQSTHPHIIKGMNINTFQYLMGKTIVEVEQKNILLEFSNLSKYNEILPITVLSSQYRKYHRDILSSRDTNDVVNKSVLKFITDAVQTLRDIEKNGLSVNMEVFNTHFSDKKKFVHEGKVYTEYHPYTMTGRPSNRFGGINFAALNKSDGSRAAFVSRFENGKLLQLDFESYHLRLLANYAYQVSPEIPIHTFLAQEYFGKTDITQEEYDEGKQITFSILYGDNVDTDISFLQNIKQVAVDKYHHYLTEGDIFAPYSNRTIFIPEGSSMNKVFNYFVQSLEFEETVTKIDKLNTALQGKKSVVILYTYDALLLDCPPEELEEVKTLTESILGENGYPLRTSFGDNYNDLRDWK
jgi:hypothetical protein